jgi:hypothetical protein
MKIDQHFNGDFILTTRHPRLIKWLITGVIWGLGLQFLVQVVIASENVPHEPFARWAEVLAPGAFVAGLTYQSSEAYHIWTKNTYQNVTAKAAGEEYGIDTTQGYLTVQYGITPYWTADLSIGATTVGWRYFATHGPSGTTHYTVGLMDVAMGVRYQILNETRDQPHWLPTLTFRAGGVFPGNYSQTFPFAPGNRSTAIEPELLLRKHLGWEGFGIYGDALFRWNATTHNDQYIAAVGFFQEIAGWELHGGYRHLGTVQGDDIVLNADRTIVYPKNVRENNDSVEAGMSYSTAKKRLEMGFYSSTVLDGANTAGAFLVGGYIKFPLGHTKPIDFSNF